MDKLDPIRPLSVVALTATLMLLFPAFHAFLALFWGASLVVAGFYLQRQMIVLLYGLTGAVFFTAGSGALLSDALTVGAPALVMSMLLSRRRDYSTIRKWGLLTGVLVTTLLLGEIFYSANQLGQPLEEQLGTVITQTVEQYLESGATNRYLDQGMSREDLLASAPAFGRLAAQYMPAFKYIQGIISVFIVLSFAGSYARRRHPDTLNKKPYPLERMPWPMAWLVILGLALVLLNWRGYGYIGGNLLAVMGLISFYFGNAAILFHYYAFSARKRIIALSVFLLGALLAPGTLLLSIMAWGVFDALIDNRKLDKTSPGVDS
jgi:hypothetical protein